MAIKIGDTDITGVFLGDTAIQKVYKGDTLIWEKQTIDLERNASYIHYNGGSADWITVPAGTKYTIKHIPQSTSKQRFVIYFYSSSATYSAYSTAGTSVSSGTNGAYYFEYTPVDLNDYLIIEIDASSLTYDLGQRIFSHITDVNDSNCCLPIDDGINGKYDQFDAGNIELTHLEDTSTPQVFFMGKETQGNSFGFKNNTSILDGVKYDMKIMGMYNGSDYKELTDASANQGITYCQSSYSEDYLFCIAKLSAGSSWNLMTEYADNQC